MVKHTDYDVPVEVIPRVLSRGIRLGLWQSWVLYTYWQHTLEPKIYAEKLPIYKAMCKLVYRTEKGKHL